MFSFSFIPFLKFYFGSAGLRESYRTDFHETLLKDGTQTESDLQGVDIFTDSLHSYFARNLLSTILTIDKLLVCVLLCFVV